jgi:hypothetical protein
MRRLEPHDRFLVVDASGAEAAQRTDSLGMLFPGTLEHGLVERAPVPQVDTSARSLHTDSAGAAERALISMVRKDCPRREPG